MEEDIKKFKKEVEKAFKPLWGPRCKYPDLKDFPDLKNKPEERCMTCLSYEKLDNFIADLMTSI